MYRRVGSCESGYQYAGTCRSCRLYTRPTHGYAVLWRRWGYKVLIYEIERQCHGQEDRPPGYLYQAICPCQCYIYRRPGQTYRILIKTYACIHCPKRRIHHRSVPCKAEPKSPGSYKPTNQSTAFFIFPELPRTTGWLVTTSDWAFQARNRKKTCLCISTPDGLHAGWARCGRRANRSPGPRSSATGVCGALGRSGAVISGDWCCVAFGGFS